MARATSAWLHVPLVLQPAADLGGRLTEQTLAGKELMMCEVTTSFSETLIYGNGLLPH